jgi:ribosome-associated translation inhibitor RaiA
MMLEPLHIAFRGMEPPIGLEDDIRDRAEALNRFFDRITACNVVVEARHHHQRQGRLYHVHIELNVPGRTIVVGREPSDDHTREDLRVAIRDAFAAAQRQLQDHAREARGDVKAHPGVTPPETRE